LEYATSRGPGGGRTDVDHFSPCPKTVFLLRGAAPPEALEGAVQMTALGRLGRPADVADLVAFLVGKDARWVTGQDIRADGGLV
jgi:3-oxoacyl-[acyl-carrier protein] reductase